MKRQSTNYVRADGLNGRTQEFGMTNFQPPNLGLIDSNNISLHIVLVIDQYRKVIIVIDFCLFDFNVFRDNWNTGKY